LIERGGKEVYVVVPVHHISQFAIPFHSSHNPIAISEPPLKTSIPTRKDSAPDAIVKDLFVNFELGRVLGEGKDQGLVGAVISTSSGYAISAGMAPCRWAMTSRA
jgi:hypothetical protein